MRLSDQEASDLRDAIFLKLDDIKEDDVNFITTVMVASERFLAVCLIINIYDNQKFFWPLSTYEISQDEFLDAMNNQKE